MATNFRDFEIVSKDGKIQNIKELCNFVDNTPIEPDDLPYLETLCNKLANDDYYQNTYINEYPLVDSLHVALLDYYINVFDFDLDQIIDILYIYNKEFNKVTKFRYDGLTYLVIDKVDNVEVFDIKDDNQFVVLVKNKANNRILVAGSIDQISDLLKTKLHNIQFFRTNDVTLNTYANNFDIADDVYYGKDLKNNNIIKMKNGLFIKTGRDVSVIHEPSLDDVATSKETKIISFRANHKKVSFDINEFVELKNKSLNDELDTTEEIQLFYHEVDYLIRSMAKKDKEDQELYEALDDYMDKLNTIYENHPDVLTEEDINNLNEYKKNIKKYNYSSKLLNNRVSHKVVSVTDIRKRQEEEKSYGISA